jgi:PAS domain S-box-containing protein
MQESKETVEVSGLDGVSRHGHLCLLYEAEAEILTPVIPFIQKGISQGERCIYLNGGEETLERALKNAILGQKQAPEALLLLPAQETWLKDGEFETGRILRFLGTLCESAAGDGFRATRIICDMGWAEQQLKLGGGLREFELQLNHFAECNEVTILCLYNRQAFPADRLLELVKVHSQLVIGGRTCDNPFFTHPAPPRAKVTELDLFLSAVQETAAAAADRARLQQELEQAYAALARKIYENWQEEDTLKASEKELQEKDEALLAHKRRLQTILQHIPAMLMAFDADDRLAACNHEFERITGFKAEEVMGRRIRELIQVEAELREELTVLHPPEGGNYRGKEWNLRCKDGSVKSISWSNISRYVPIPGWNNWLIGLDVTPRVHAELGLRSLSDELEARTGELEALGYAVSHDLSGQLSQISGQCAVMDELCGVALSPQCRELLRTIHEATLAMVARITALQRYSVLAAGGVKAEEVDLSAIASEIAAQLSGAGGSRGVTFEIEAGVTATGDEKLLRLAMEQLLENAWNYTLGVAHPVIQFGTAQVEGRRSYFISDNGPRDNHLESHLDRGFGKGNHVCCGIGLATVQRIISLHRGRIWSAEQAGTGGTLYFRV